MAKTKTRVCVVAIGQVLHRPVRHTFNQTCNNGPTYHVALFATACLVYVVHRVNHRLHFCDTVMPRRSPQGLNLKPIF